MLDYDLLFGSAYERSNNLAALAAMDVQNQQVLQKATRLITSR